MSSATLRVSVNTMKACLLSCFAVKRQAAAGGVIIWGIFTWHVLGPLAPSGHHLKFRVLLLIMATVYPSSNTCFQ